MYLSAHALKSVLSATKRIMKQSFQNIIDPKTAFTRLKYEPKWVAVLTIYCLFSFLLGWTLLPYTEQLLAARSVDTVSYSKTISFIAITVFSMGYSVLMAMLFSVILTITVQITKCACGITFRHISAGFFPYHADSDDDIFSQCGTTSSFQRY